MSASRDPLPWLPGARYAPHSVLGEGGTAVVYRTYDHDEKRWVAVKMMHKRPSKSSRARQRFLDEARVLQSLEHRNLAKVVDVVGEAARPFFVMEVAEGGSLMRWVRQHGAMPPRLAVDAAIQICKGVGAAHKMGVIHRDVKPHNVLVTLQGVCKVIDFGIAQLPRTDGTSDIPDAIDATNPTGVAGTLGYMAPEQRKDPRSVDPRTDVYGIGATLYTLLTGRTVVDLFIAEQEPELLEGLPEPLVPVLRKATAYRADDRYDNVAELARDLFGARAELEETDDTLEVERPRHPQPPPRPPAEAPDIPPSDTGAFILHRPQSTPPSQLELPAPPSPTSRLALRVGLALAPVAVALGLTGSALAIGTYTVQRAETDVAEAHLDLYRSLDQELAIVDDLSEVGADGEALERLYTQQRAATDEERLWAARRYIEALERDVKAHASVNGRNAAMARERLLRIRSAQQSVVDANLALDTRTQGGLGGLAVRLGLVEVR